MKECPICHGPMHRSGNVFPGDAGPYCTPFYCYVSRHGLQEPETRDRFDAMVSDLVAHGMSRSDAAGIVVSELESERS
jgi:hypothetical protein